MISGIDLKAIELLKENNLYTEAVWEELDGKILCVEINWGDWKHDHLRCDWLIKENFNVVFNSTEITEEDGSDTYSAIHRYLMG